MSTIMPANMETSNSFHCLAGQVANINLMTSGLCTDQKMVMNQERSLWFIDMNSKHCLKEIIVGPEEVIFDATCFEENRSWKKSPTCSGRK